jgi:phosphoglycolate phosphatase-like HAD superfamily hydrolase
MARPSISLVITDLDNTLYDWVSAFVPALYEMVREAAPMLEIEHEDLLCELRAVHQKHRDTEHPFALLETRSVIDKFTGVPSAELAEILDPAFYAFNRTRKNNLRLYEGVPETLAYLSKVGVPIVAYTDARVANSVFRLKSLNVDKFIDRLYAPEHVVDKSQGASEGGIVRLLPSGDRKPNPQTLIDISAEYDVAPSSVLYIGDSLVRDVYMAKRAGVRSAWAKFGTSYDKSLWEQLVRVTHWTADDVEREEALKHEAKGIEPDVVLSKFSDIIDHYDFFAPKARQSA